MAKYLASEAAWEAGEAAMNTLGGCLHFPSLLSCYLIRAFGHFAMSWHG